jgi:hypothetical protein
MCQRDFSKAAGLHLAHSMVLLSLATDADLTYYMPKGFFKSCELAPDPPDFGYSTVL